MVTGSVCLFCHGYKVGFQSHNCADDDCLRLHVNFEENTTSPRMRWSYQNRKGKIKSTRENNVSGSVCAPTCEEENTTSGIKESNKTLELRWSQNLTGAKLLWHHKTLKTTFSWLFHTVVLRRRDYQLLWNIDMMKPLNILHLETRKKALIILAFIFKLLLI